MIKLLQKQNGAVFYASQCSAYHCEPMPYDVLDEAVFSVIVLYLMF